ncbi:MAG: BCCT family transporter [Actinomycetota bacterium]|nr:BCCT family transporter [Actinomycetota bacterium]
MRAIRAQLTPVFYVSAALALAFVLWGALAPAHLFGVTSDVLAVVVRDFGWLYLIATTFFLAFAIGLALSRHGRLRLGKEGDRPEFGRLSWFAMLFQAGMGIGIVFWGVAEPVSHFAAPPYGLATPGSTQAGDLAIRYSFFHWALHPWAVYAVIAMAIAYFNFRRDEPGLVSAVFRPLLGDRVDGPLGKAIDVLALLATLFGVAVSLGLGALQINSGLNYLFGVPVGTTSQIVIIAVTGVCFMASAATGIQRGVKWLSNASLVLAAALIAFMMVAGPTVLQLNALTQGMGSYLGDLVPMSFRMNAFTQDPWIGKWTLFYWATWISWAPYVGAFIARISRGRSIREFVTGVLIVPSLVSFLWFAVLGSSAIDLDRGLGGRISAAVQADPAVATFATLDHFPLALVTSLIAVSLVFIFFVAGADAASIVLGRMSAGGVLNPRAPIKLIWGAAMAACSAVLLVAGGLDALQQASILAAVPFTFIMLGMCAALLRALGAERRRAGQEESASASPEPEAAAAG